jgi:hypothetical protein
MVGTILQPPARWTFQQMYRFTAIAFFMVFAVGSITSTVASSPGSLFGQDMTPLGNAIEIAKLQRQLADVGDVKTEVSILRERTIKIEAEINNHSKDLADIAAMERWIVFGILGTLAMQVKRLLDKGPQLFDLHRRQDRNQEEEDPG